MKISIVNFFLLIINFSFLPFLSFSEKKTISSWGEESQAVYELLLAQMQDSIADYDASVSTLVKYAKRQKKDLLLSKTYRALLQTERYSEALEIANIWKNNSKFNIDKLYILSLVLNKQSSIAFLEIKRIIQQIISKNNKGKLTKSQIQEKILTDYAKLLLDYWYHPEILVIFEKLHNYYSNNFAVNQAYIDLLCWHGDFDKAINIIDKLLFKSPRNLNMLQQKSVVYRYSLRLKEAESVWLGALKDYPNDLQLRVAYADFLIDIYAFQKAKIQLDLLPEKDIDISISMRKLEVAMQLEQYKEAENSFNWSALNDYEKDNARYDYGKKLLQKKQYDLALKQFAKVNKEGKLALAADVGIGIANYAKGLSYGDAWFAILQKKYNLNNTDFIANKSSAMISAGKKNAAYKFLNNYIKSNPKDDYVRYIRSSMAMDMQQNDQVLDDLKYLYANSPYDANNQNNLGYYLLSKKKEIDYGIKLIKKSFLSNPNAIETVDSMGWASYQQKKYKKALFYFRYAYRKNNIFKTTSQYLDGEIIGHYIAVLVAIGKRDLANKIYKLEMQYKPNRKKIQLITKGLGLSE